MVRFLIESDSSFKSRVHRIFAKEVGENILNIPNRAIYTPEINADNNTIIKFVGDYKNLDCIEKQRNIRHIIREYNKGFIADDEMTLIKCLIAAEKIRLDAIMFGEEVKNANNINKEYREPYKVTFDMRSLMVETLHFDVFEPEDMKVTKVLSLGSILNFLNLYCGDLSVDVEITVCLCDFDYEIMDNKWLLKESLLDIENIIFVECSELEEVNTEDIKEIETIDVVELLDVETSQHEKNEITKKYKKGLHKKSSKKKKKGKKGKKKEIVAG